ncbi:serine/threonine protein kinase [Paraliomyxa miuraensis]|uniref:serine/threonine protein kinase n=1 Tax=Paraliomyxa miuraensis TaxID=376150 RepID=UPI002256BBBB|nr:serine/threonine-protein kinase [Paraliomyxa miuraensis]MCX4244301.1 protein kinase [Paraliomyxa miuraensis]
MEAEPETKVLARESTTKDEPASVRDPLGVGKTVGRYDLVHRLGHGGMAVVYLGRATGRAGFEKLVAVKVIHPHLAAEPEFVEMFRDEARIAARLHHPHVVDIHDLGEDQGVLFMVMEYVEGETLASLIRTLRKQGEHLPLSAVLQIVADACEGLAAAHDLTHADGRPMHLVHRDVSPHNLLVSMDGRVKVVDFGIAKATGRRSSTRTGQLRGKLAYMSPEQAGGTTIDHRTDLFALGAVLWELLTNERLFMADTESETLARVNACEVPEIQERRPDVPRGVAALLTRALARDPEERFPTAQEMLRELRAQLRQLDDVDPRAELAAVMDRSFAKRMGYIRAAVRRAGESGVTRERAANDPISPEDATRATDRPLEISTLSGLARRSSGSMPAVADLGVGPGTNTHTLTASLATAPARHWSLWLLLPLLGAVAGAAIVSRGLNEPRDEMPRLPDASPTASTLEGPVVDPEMVAAATIKWRFDTEPNGATIILDGKPHPEPSPVTIEIPRGDEPIEVVISKTGYHDRTAHPVPLAPGNFNYRLEPLAVTEPEPTTEPTRDPPSTWLTAPTRKTSKKGKDAEGKADEDDGDDKTNGNDGDGKTGADHPQLPPKPNFSALRNEPGKPTPTPPAP